VSHFFRAIAEKCDPDRTDATFHRVLPCRLIEEACHIELFYYNDGDHHPFVRPGGCNSAGASVRDAEPPGSDTAVTLQRERSGARVAGRGAIQLLDCRTPRRIAALRAARDIVP